jgi:hypothetical protein
MYSYFDQSMRSVRRLETGQRNKLRTGVFLVLLLSGTLSPPPEVRNQLRIDPGPYRQFCREVLEGTHFRSVIRTLNQQFVSPGIHQMTSDSLVSSTALLAPRTDNQLHKANILLRSFAFSQNKVVPLLLCSNGASRKAAHSR